MLLAEKGVQGKGRQPCPRLNAEAAPHRAALRFAHLPKNASDGAPRPAAETLA
jgi:hypothetical protein